MEVVDLLASLASDIDLETIGAADTLETSHGLDSGNQARRHRRRNIVKAARMLLGNDQQMETGFRVDIGEGGKFGGLPDDGSLVMG